MPRVSVIIPTYNRPGLLRETLASVASQTFDDFEIIVIDDGSTTPGIKDICDSFGRCRYYRQENAGRSSARNVGMSHASSPYIAFLDDDDLWKPQKLARQVQFLDDHLDVGLVHCPAEQVDEAGRKTGIVLGGNLPEIRQGRVFFHAIDRCIVKSPTPMLRRDVTDQVGGFDVNLNSLEDLEYWARVAYVSILGFEKTPLAWYRVHDHSSTNRTYDLNQRIYITRKLAGVVRPEDRSRVRRISTLAYLRMIGNQTERLSSGRIKHLFTAITLSPRCVFSRRFISAALRSRAN